MVRWFARARKLECKRVLVYPNTPKSPGAPKKHSVEYLFTVQAYFEMKMRIEGVKSYRQASRELVALGSFEPEIGGKQDSLAGRLRGQHKEARRDPQVQAEIQRMEIDWNDSEDVYRAAQIAYSARYNEHGHLPWPTGK